jgi:hypothetical protein
MKNTNTGKHSMIIKKRKENNMSKILTITLISLIITGCSSRGGYSYYSADYSGYAYDNKQFKNAVVVISGKGGNIHHQGSDEFYDNLQMKVQQIFQTDINNEPFLKLIDESQPISEMQIVPAAKKLNIDILVILRLDEFEVTYSVGLPYIFKAVKTADYSFKIIDTATGKVLLDSSRFMRSHHFDFSGSDKTADMFIDDIKRITLRKFN